MLTHVGSQSALCLILFLACRPTAPAVDVAAEREAVRQAMEGGTRALEQHDWSAYAAFWANDADVSIVHPGARDWVDGWDAIATKYRAVIADTSAHFRATSLRQDIHLAASGEMAWVTQQDSLYFTTRGETTAVLQWSTAVFEKRGGQWKAVHGHATQFTSRD